MGGWSLFRRHHPCPAGYAGSFGYAAALPNTLESVLRGSHGAPFIGVVTVYDLVHFSVCPKLVETKHDLKDARRKAKHVPEYFGKVLFLIKDHDRFRVVKTEDGIGDIVDPADLETLRSELQKTAP